MLSLAPHEVAYVGDHYTTDAVGAHAAGLRAYWLNRTALEQTTENGITTIPTLKYLCTLLPES